MAEKLEFVPCAENEEHLARHTNSESLVVGSKATKDVTKADITSISLKFDEAYRSMIEEKGNPGRQIFALTTSKAVGTDPLVPIESLDPSKVFEIVREPGTPGEAKVKVAIVSKEDMPKTNVVHAIYGPYGPTGKGGNYTMMFGDPGEPFPRTLPEDASQVQNDINEKAKQYWDTHVLLITPEELDYAIGKMKEHNIPTATVEMRRKLFEHKPSSPIIVPSHSKVSENAINLGGVILSGNEGRTLQNE